MKAPQLVLVVVVAAVTLTSVAAAGPEAAKQRVAIVSNGLSGAIGPYRFALSPLQAGALGRDTGTATSSFGERKVLRDGQSVTVTLGLETYEGKRGSLTVRFGIAWVDAGNGYHPGTGTWEVVRGTGDYAGLSGGGRSGNVWLERAPRPWSTRLEGFLTRP